MFTTGTLHVNDHGADHKGSVQRAISVGGAQVFELLLTSIQQLSAILKSLVLSKLGPFLWVSSKTRPRIWSLCIEAPMLVFETPNRLRHVSSHYHMFASGRRGLKLSTRLSVSKVMLALLVVLASMLLAELKGLCLSCSRGD